MLDLWSGQQVLSCRPFQDREDHPVIISGPDRATWENIDRTRYVFAVENDSEHTILITHTVHRNSDLIEKRKKRKKYESIFSSFSPFDRLMHLLWIIFVNLLHSYDSWEGFWSLQDGIEDLIRYRTDWFSCEFYDAFVQKSQGRSQTSESQLLHRHHALRSNLILESERGGGDNVTLWLPHWMYSSSESDWPAWALISVSRSRFTRLEFIEYSRLDSSWLSSHSVQRDICTARIS